MNPKYIKKKKGEKPRIMTHFHGSGSIQIPHFPWRRREVEVSVVFQENSPSVWFWAVIPHVTLVGLERFFACTTKAKGQVTFPKKSQFIITNHHSLKKPAFLATTEKIGESWLSNTSYQTLLRCPMPTSKKDRKKPQKFFSFLFMGGGRGVFCKTVF